MECLRPRQIKKKRLAVLLCTIYYILYYFISSNILPLKPSIDRIDTFCRKSFDHMIAPRVFK